MGASQGNKLTRSWSGSARPQLSQLTEPLWIDPGLKSGIEVRELITTYKKRKRKTQMGIDLLKIVPSNPRAREKRPPPPPPPPLPPPPTPPQPRQTGEMRPIRLTVFGPQIRMRDSQTPFAIYYLPASVSLLYDVVPFLS